MLIVPESVEIVVHHPGYEDVSLENFLERVGRLCYKSEGRIEEGSAGKFISKIRDNGHHAMLEHCVASARIVCNRGLTHELVRHRMASYAQESTRYCNYSKDKFGKMITVIMPPFKVASSELIWRRAMVAAEGYYFEMLGNGEPPEIARDVLPIGTKTEIWITCNLREWRHVFAMRCSPKAHPQIRKVMLEILRELCKSAPTVFGDLKERFLDGR